MRTTASGSLRKRRHGIRVLSSDVHQLDRLSRAILFYLPLRHAGGPPAAKARRAKRA